MAPCRDLRRTLNTGARTGVPACCHGSVLSAVFALRIDLFGSVNSHGA